MKLQSFKCKGGDSWIASEVSSESQVCVLCKLTMWVGGAGKRKTGRRRSCGRKAGAEEENSHYPWLSFPCGPLTSGKCGRKTFPQAVALTHSLVYWVELSLPKIYVYTEPQNVALIGNRIFADVIKLEMSFYKIWVSPFISDGCLIKRKIWRHTET